MTREEAISMLEQIGRHECIWMVCRHNEVYDAIDIAIEALKEQRPHGEWITCSERLPSSDGKYLINYHSPRGNNCIQIQNFMNGDWYPNFGKSYITAWMPLPEPYEKEGEVE